ncbi:unannotated protein [freshwater metagenome]|uniref:Unannotated protein n=1 Tax=freshwater metagenome TaxID=449393 RepID=A0A6J7PCB0_9ZZZZ
MPPLPVTICRYPSGKPASASKRASRIDEKGVCEAGFKTTAQPAAIAGPTLCTTRLSGKLNGEIAPTTPTGTLSVNPILPPPTAAASSGTVSPVSVRATALENWKVAIARSASPRAVLIGFADSRAMAIAKSSLRSAIKSAALSNISARCHCANGRSSIDLRAYATPASTSAAVSAGTWPRRAPSNGECTSMTAAPAVSSPHNGTGVTSVTWIPGMSCSMGRI